MAQYAQVPFLLPGMHTALQDSVKWNSEWEKLTNQFKHVSPAQFVQSSALQLALESDGMDTSMLQYQGFLGSLVALELALAPDTVRYLSGGLQSKWTEADPAVREKHILIGLSNACSIAKNLHDARIYCGRDFQLSRLRANGEIVLEWLTSLVMPANGRKYSDLLDAPNYIPDPVWDAYAEQQKQSGASDSEKLALGTILVLRSKLIFHVVQYTLKSFMGEDLPTYNVPKFSKKRNPQSTVLQKSDIEAFTKMMLGKSGAKAYAKENKAAWQDRQKDRKEHCTFVGCMKANTGTEKYPRCKKCWENMKREVVYCSTQCQVADWKSNHKQVCGKPLSFDSVSKPKLTHARTPEEMAPIHATEADAPLTVPSTPTTVWRSYI
ncbi:hypothetical protein R3P38DRAFT_2581333 [Favolaschia claudopus]|uniref:MYND-type domain-containing protein n=1 Tax=Favolaschia claudopus TaxID=2862362 RepID=A0AAV9ZBJ0_9AGAR